MSYANSDTFTFSFLIWMTFISFSCMIFWLGPPILWWIKVRWVAILVFFLILMEKLSSFHQWVWYYLCVCQCGLHYVEGHCLYIHFIESFYHKHMWIFKMLFLHLLRSLYNFYTSFCYCGISHWLIAGIEPSCIPGINLTWTFCVFFLICFLIHLVIFCWVFLDLLRYWPIN